MHRSRFITLRLERHDLHLRERLARLHEIAFANEDVFDASTQLRGDIDLGRFDAPIAADEGVAETLRLQRAPKEPRDYDYGDDDRDRNDSFLEVLVHHRRFAIRPRRACRRRALRTGRLDLIAVRFEAE